MDDNPHRDGGYPNCYKFIHYSPSFFVFFVVKFSGHCRTRQVYFLAAISAKLHILFRPDLSAGHDKVFAAFRCPRETIKALWFVIPFATFTSLGYVFDFVCHSSPSFLRGYIYFDADLAPLPRGYYPEIVL